MTEQDSKKQFAFYLSKGEKPLFAAKNLFDSNGWNDPALMLVVANTWPYDELVIEELTRLRNIVPTKEELISDMMVRAKTAADDDYSKIMKLILESLGYTGKGTDASKEKATDRLAELAAMVLAAPETKDGAIV